MHFRAYLREVTSLLEQATEQAATTIVEAARLIADTIADGRVLSVFGPSHAGILAQDLFYRAGGVAAIEPILPAGLMLNERPVTRTSALERLPGYAEVILRDLPLGAGDVLLIISVSGRNAVAVEMCTGAQARGAVALEGLEQRVGPTSTAVGSAILHGLMVEVAGQLLQRGLRPPVLVSANLDGADTTNGRLFAAYRGRLSYL
jgi:uncharacterized phosphosugar-binding protein